MEYIQKGLIRILTTSQVIQASFFQIILCLRFLFKLSTFFPKTGCISLGRFLSCCILFGVVQHFYLSRGRDGASFAEIAKLKPPEEFLSSLEAFLLKLITIY